MAEDFQLVQACRQGDLKAFEEIVSRYQSLVCAITYSAVGNRAVSEDLAQETFFQAWKKLDQLKQPVKFRSWLCCIARSAVSSYLRVQKRIPVVSHNVETLEAVKKGASPPELLIDQEQERFVNSALMRIPEEYREPLVLYYRQNRSTQEVAEAMGLREATVRTRLHRARQMLRREIESRIETTLERTAPGAAFTRSVMGVVGAGLAAGIAGTVTAAGAGEAAGGILAGMQAKVIAAAAVAVVGAGSLVTYHHYSHSEPVDTAAVESVSNPWVPRGAVLPQAGQTALSSEHIVSLDAPEASPESQWDVFQTTPEPAERADDDDFDAWFESLITEYTAQNSAAAQTPEQTPPTGVRTRVAGGDTGEEMRGGGMMGGMGGGMMGGMGMGGYRIEIGPDGEPILPEDVGTEEDAEGQDGES